MLVSGTLTLASQRRYRRRRAAHLVDTPRPKLEAL